MTDDRRSFFLVIEGLDGSGKTYLARRLAALLRGPLGAGVALTFEPHDASAAGLFIRQVLTRRIPAAPRTLALAYALNRADHNDRVIRPFLDGAPGRLLICDRYYLSSLVYQSVPPLTMAEVRALNGGARRPDLTVFLDASPETCYARMDTRPEDRELFEENLERTRHAYADAIAFLRAEGDDVEVVNADGSADDVLRAVLDVLAARGPAWLRTAVAALAPAGEAPASAANDAALDALVRDGADASALRAALDVASDERVGAALCDFLSGAGFRVGEPLDWGELRAWALACELPLGLGGRGAAVLLPPGRGAGAVTKRVLALLDSPSDASRTDFLIVLDRAPTEPALDPARDAAGPRASPAVRVLTLDDLARALAERGGRD